MPKPLESARRRAVLLVATAGLATGCDLQEDADLDRGRALFLENCQACHALAEAGTTATVGPDLDASFAAARESGQDQDTIEGVVQSQIENPRTIEEDDPDYDQVFMPADLVTGRDAEDVAAYVASVAGIPGIEPPPLGESNEVFVEKCGGCHGLEAAGTTSATGPALDGVLPGQKPAQIAQSIREPNAEISEGFGPDIMPSFDEGQLPEENLQALIQYLLDSVSGGS